MIILDPYSVAYVQQHATLAVELDTHRIVDHARDLPGLFVTNICDLRILIPSFITRLVLRALVVELEKGQAGQAFEDFLKEQGTYEETTEQAVKCVVAFQLAQAMKEQGITKVEMARRLSMS